MKKLVGVLLVMLLAAMLIGLVGCGEKKTTVEVDGEKIEVTEENGEVTVESEEGTSTTTTDVDLDKLGVPIYPGAELAEGETGAVTTETPEGTGTLVTLVSGDSIDKVANWYKDQLSGRENFYDMSTTAGEAGSVYLYSYLEGNTYNSVAINEGELGFQEGKTVITIVSGTGDMVDQLPEELP